MLKMRAATFAAMGLSLLLVQASRAAIVTTFEAPGVQTAPASLQNASTIDFNSATAGWHYNQAFTLGSLTATYVGNQFIVGAGQYGGAGGSSQYLAVQQDTPEQDDSVTINLSESQAYFGMWLSAADAYNRIAFYNGGTLLKLFSAVGPEMTALSDSYLGNPNDDFLGKNDNEKYVFVNFFAQTSGDKFDKIVFTNLYGGGTELESDNHTFSATLQAPGAVPEPSTLASSGIALVLLAGRWVSRRRRVSPIA